MNISLLLTAIIKGTSFMMQHQSRISKTFKGVFMSDLAKKMPFGVHNGSVSYQNDEILIMNLIMALNNGDRNIDPDLEKKVNYESVWLDKTGAGSLKIYNPNEGKFNIILKMESSDSEAVTFCSIVKPNGQNQEVGAPLKLTPHMNEDKGWYKDFSDGMVGTYSIEYLAHANEGIRILCWVY